MQRSIWRTVTLVVLTVMITRNSFGQQTITSGDRYFDISVYHDNDDLTGVTTIVCKGKQLYMMQMQDGKVLNFSVDGRHIPADSLAGYQSVIEDIKVQLKETEEQARRNRAQAELNRQQAERNREQAQQNREQAERDRQQAEENRQQAERNREEAQRNREQAALNRQQMDRDRQQADQNRIQAQQNRLHAEENRQQAIRDREQAQQDLLQAERSREEAARDREQAELNRQQAERNREQAERNRQQAERNRERMDTIINDLISDGVVPDRDSLHSIRMDEDGIFVNGKRLPEALEKKYRDRFVKPGSSMSYHND